ncbi:MAG: glycosyltransferase family 39 protein [Bacteroidales bacterium]|nr:glycosyltransferase family 39 protein [Bacteroidales bacterium]MBN2817863.1 glycosyltransferase family 39 protein [Bacteroidales bacterium]
MNLKRLFFDIRIWIIFFFLIRLIGITNPPLEVGHSWRQTTVTMVARNFYEVDNNIFYPRIDIAGEKTGITGMEFPLLNYLIYLVSVLFGYQHWYGRLINLFFSSLGLLFFYKLLRKYFSEQVSFYSTIILTVSIWFQFSRKIMPDTFAMSLIIASIYYGTNYLETRQYKKQYIYLLSYFLFMCIGILSKLPSACLLVVFGFYLLDKQIPKKKKSMFSLVTFIGLIPVFIWYFYWVPYLNKEYDFKHFFMGKSIIWGFKEIIQFANLILGRFYETALQFIGFAAFIYGLIISIRKRDRKIYSVFIITLVFFSFIILKAGSTFAHHNYYIIPFVPVMALVAGYGLSQIKNSKIAVIILFAISVEGIANQHQDFKIKEKNKSLLNLEKDLNKVSDKDDLIIINSGIYPTPMYFSHHKGWIDSNNKINDEKYINDLKAKGLKYIIILKQSFGTEIKFSQYKKVLENVDYCIYQL